MYIQRGFEGTITIQEEIFGDSTVYELFSKEEKRPGFMEKIKRGKYGGVYTGIFDCKHRIIKENVYILNNLILEKKYFTIFDCIYFQSEKYFFFLALIIYFSTFSILISYILF